MLFSCLELAESVSTMSSAVFEKDKPAAPPDHFSAVLSCSQLKLKLEHRNSVTSFYIQYENVSNEAKFIFAVYLILQY